MHGLVAILLSVSVLLALACLLLPLATRLLVPYSAVLAVLGIVVGTLAGLPIGGANFPAPISDLLQGVRGVGLTGEILLYVFLPSLLFAAGLSVDVRRLMDDAAPILIMAIVAVVVCTAVVGVSLNATFGVPLAVAALLGAVIATTDPAAVVAIFRDIGVPRRLQILVEGESLFNDAAAIALFTILLGVVSGRQSGDPMLGALAMAWDFLGGLLFGYLAARALCALLHLVSDHPVAEVTLTVSLAYGIYVVGDVYLGVSGVVATVTAALVVGSIGRTHMSAEGWNRLQSIWHQIEFLASTLIFVLAATTIPKLLSDLRGEDLAMLGVVVAATLVARALVLYGLLPLLSAARLAARVGASHKAVILWGGLRGAVTLAMALAVLDNPAIPREYASQVAVLATGFVLFTLFVNAPTLRPLIRVLGLNRLNAVEMLLRDHTMAVSNASVRKSLAPVIHDFGDHGKATLPLPNLVAPLAQATGAPSPAAMSAGDALRIGLITLAAQEEKLLLQGRADRTFSNRIVGRCIAQAGRLKDAAKTGGRWDYLLVAHQGLLASTRVFRAALYLHTRFGLAAPLAKLLGLRFEALLVTRATLKHLREFTHRAITPMLGAETEQAILDVLAVRQDGLDTAISAFEMQYPGYAQLLRSSYVGRAALRLEEAEYAQKREDGLISAEVYRALVEDMQQRRKAVDGEPELKLGLEVTGMIRQVPLFAGTGEAQLLAIARLLRPRLAVPGETIIRKGERGDAMFFIAAGNVEVSDGASPRKVIREAGSFFGEIALIYNTPRTAEVSAVGYCHLLVLYARDLQRLLRQHPEAKEAIERAAHARLRAKPDGTA